MFIGSTSGDVSVWDTKVPPSNTILPVAYSFQAHADCANGLRWVRLDQYFTQNQRRINLGRLKKWYSREADGWKFYVQEWDCSADFPSNFSIIILFFLVTLHFYFSVCMVGYHSSQPFPVSTIMWIRLISRTPIENNMNLRSIRLRKRTDWNCGILIYESMWLIIKHIFKNSYSYSILITSQCCTCDSKWTRGWDVWTMDNPLIQ